jgi:hypothetical protein
MTSMMIAMMVAGIGSVLAGLLVILYGIPIREFGFGNTLILIGVLAVCTGMILLALSAVVAELKVIARRLMESRIGPETRQRPIPPSVPEPLPAESPAAGAEGEPPPANFEDAWPKADRGRNGDVPPQRRSARTPPAAPEASASAPAEHGAPPPSEAQQPGVTVLKSGVVDGMAYSLYSDGSIEAQMPEGLMRFASLDELTAHIDRRP